MIHLLPAISSTSAALNVERTRMEIIAQNIANANSTHGPDGKPYQRQQVVFESALQQARSKVENTSQALVAPKVARIQKDTSAGRSVFQPTHPDADSNGIVHLPNINVYTEMADMIAATRTFEANLAVVKNARSMTLQAMAIGKR
jgi:flagellar basal-body rod protein FlgC